MSDMADVIIGLMALSFLVIAILNLVGLGYTSKIVWNDGDVKELTNTQKNLVKMTNIFAWITVVVGAIKSVTPNKK